MKKSLYAWQIAGFIFTCTAGVLLHFLFDFSGQSVFVAPFSAVNESVWEHLKLLFFPMLAFSVVQSRYTGKKYSGFRCIKLIGILSSVALIAVLFYTLNGIFGTTPDRINIAIFFVASIWGYALETYLFDKNSIKCKYSVAAIISLAVVAVLFAVFTFAPPQIPLFEDPVTLTYGY